MSQQLTIMIDGMDGVLPDSVGNVLSAVFDLINFIDKESWGLEVPRFRWQVSEVRLVNPLTVTANATPKVASQIPERNFALELIECLRQIDRGNRPSNIPNKQLRRFRTIAKEARRSRRISITGKNERSEETFDVPKAYSKKVNRLLRASKEITKEYGSLEGMLIGLANDPLKDDGSAKLREQASENEVSCHASPEVTTRMGHFTNRQTKVILYGTVTFEDGIAKRIDVEDFSDVPDEVMSLEAIRELGIRPPNGLSVEGYLDDLRGE